MTIIATIVLLGVLIFVHELGHFAAAKSVGVEVQRFSIGLGPKVWGFTRGETEYVLSAIPLGGYVKMGGMDDEVMERIEGGPAAPTPKAPGPRDFDGKPLWARAWVISAGVIMNMLFAFATYAFVAGYWGTAHSESTQVGTVRAEMLPPGTESLAQIPLGAWIERVGDVEPAHWGEVAQSLFQAEGTTTLSGRDPAFSVTIDAPVAEGERALLAAAMSSWLEPVIGVVMPGGPAERGGLEAGDRVAAVDGRGVETWWDFQGEIYAREGVETTLEIVRDGRELTRIVTPERTVLSDPVAGEDRRVGAIGIRPADGEIVYEPLPLGDAVRYGWDQTIAVTGMILGFLRDLVTGGVSPRSMGSIVTIGEASGQAASMGMDVFLNFMALFSINLAVLNLLPIPVLDGGHLLFLAIEAVRGRALSIEQRLRWSNVGFLIVMGIMIWALGNDFLRLFGL
ncbi:MAG: RIP metalloprotease RseP [Gemmatimonadetes bacterium]|nr:RIP metalloprotease RseP [Gemmatimonadota bacterium]